MRTKLRGTKLRGTKMDTMETFINQLQLALWGRFKYYKEGRQWYNYAKRTHIYAQDLYDLLIKEVKEK